MIRFLVHVKIFDMIRFLVFSNFDMIRISWFSKFDMIRFWAFQILRSWYHHHDNIMIPKFWDLCRKSWTPKVDFSIPWVSFDRTKACGGPRWALEPPRAPQHFSKDVIWHSKTCLFRAKHRSKHMSWKKWKFWVSKQQKSHVHFTTVILVPNETHQNSRKKETLNFQFLKLCDFQYMICCTGWNTVF